MEIEVFFSNKTYNNGWYEDVKINNPIQFKVIETIIETIRDFEGEIFTQTDVVKRNSEVKKYIEDKSFRIIPSSNPKLVGNGEEINHVKFSPSKSVAILWEVINDKIYITFDDHTPVPYLRAIKNFHRLRVGEPTILDISRTSRKLLNKLKIPYNKKMYGVNIARQHSIY